MDAKALEKMRPRDASAAEIGASLERMEEVLLQLRAETSALQASRRGLLLSGTNADLDKVDNRLRSLNLDAERIEANTEALRLDLSVARGREQLARIEALRFAAVQAAGAYSKFWSDEYQKHAIAIAAGLALGGSAHIAGRAYAEALRQADRNQDVHAAGGVPSSHEPWPAAPRAFYGQQAKDPALLVCLPAVEPGNPIFWPTDFALLQVKRGEQSAYER